MTLELQPWAESHPAPISVSTVIGLTRFYFINQMRFAGFLVNWAGRSKGASIGGLFH